LTSNRARNPPIRIAFRRRTLPAAFLLFVAIVFGGGGSGAGIFNLIVQLTALAIIFLNSDALSNFFKRAPSLLTWLVAATLFLPIFQSLPLPPSVWQALPGRSLVIESLNFLDDEGSWFPMSLNWRRTMIAFFALMPPFAILILVWDTPKIDQKPLTLLLVGACIFVILLGALQLKTGNQRFFFFDETFGSNELHGTFANRNSAGLFIDIALCALIGTFPKGGPSKTWLLGAGVISALFLVGLVLTRSRSSLMLSLIPLALLVYKAVRSETIQKFPRRAIIRSLVGLALLTASAATLVIENNQIQRTFSRFDDLQDIRPLIWSDTMVAVKRFWPLGSGIGTFDEVFQVDEALENLGPGRAARAHNDYLEVALESGLFGLTLLAGWALLLLTSVFRAARSAGHESAPIAALALLAFQSILDYPLRNQALLCVAALMLAFLIHTPQSHEPR
jgi:exopolysaccharide production protein ExoQ